MAFIGNLVPSVELVQGSAKYKVKIGDTFDSLTYTKATHGNVMVGVGEPVDYTDEEVKLEKAKLVGIELGGLRDRNNFGEVYDTIPTYMYQTDDKAHIRDAGETYTVPYLLVEVVTKAADESAGTPEETERHRIAVSKIKEVAGTFNEGDDEPTTTAVDLNQAGASAASVITEAKEGSTVALSAGTVEEELTVSKGVTVTGSNSGVPQNSKQEV